jgi:hypothetical protein
LHLSHRLDRDTIRIIGPHKGVVDLAAAIYRFIAEHNQQSKPFVWTADPDKIIAAATRRHQMLDSIR